jgi:alkaline phosphatase D
MIVLLTASRSWRCRIQVTRCVPLVDSLMPARRCASIFALVAIALAPGVPADEPLQRIAFGSCIRQDKPQPIWTAVLSRNPQLFIFLGDNIYGDTEDMSLLRQKWGMLSKSPGMQKLRERSKILGTWDDHDFGANDAGADYARRRESQQLFLDFLGVPGDSERRRREGVYHSEIIGEPGRRVQIILMDGRYFRSPLKEGFKQGEPGEGIRGPYLPNTDAGVTLLGEAQWAWLEAQLRQPAEVRLLCCGIQMIPDEHGWENWGNFPSERKRLFRLLRDTAAAGVVLLSGDRHFAELMRLPPGPETPSYPLYEVTSTSMNQPSKNQTTAGTRFVNEINSYRLGLAYFETNFGSIDIDWSASDPLLRLQVRDEAGGVVIQRRVYLSELQPISGSKH